MKQFFDYNENITEIENENLRNIGFTPEVLQTLFLFAFVKELDNDLFENETISNTASMLNVWPIYLYWVERDEELFNENFGDMCEFFDALVEEFRRNITSDNIDVDWQLDINNEDVYVIFSEKEELKPIFFDWFNLDVQKRFISDELQDTYGFDDEESKVISVSIDENYYGYDEENPENSMLLQHVHAETDCGCWLLVWDAEEHEFNTVMRLDQNEDDDEDEEHSKLFYVWLYEGGDDGADDAGKDSFKDYDDAVAYADAFVKDCDVVGKFVDDGNYIWNLKKGERIAIVRNYDNDDLYMTDICTVK